MVGKAGQAGQPFGIVLCEGGGPVVIDAIDEGAGLHVTDLVGAEGHAVDHLGVDAIKVLVLDSKLGVGGVVDASAGVRGEADFFQPLLPVETGGVCPGF